MSTRRDEVAAAVLSILASRVKMPAADVTLDTDLAAAGLQSLDVLEVIFDLEEHFGIQIPDPPDVQERFAAYRTPSTIVDLVIALTDADAQTDASR